MNQYGGEGPQPSNRQAKIATWNARGISGRLLEIDNYLLGNSIDVLCLQELWIQPQQTNTLRNRFAELGYTLWISFAPGNNGAKQCAVAVLTRLRSSQISTKMDRRLQGRAQAVQICTGSASLICFNLHGPHDEHLKAQLFRAIGTRVAELRLPAVWIGDFNTQPSEQPLAPYLISGVYTIPDTPAEQLVPPG